jgi:hypothetical protein
MTHALPLGRTIISSCPAAAWLPLAVACAIS